jgi:hypothetical protein
LFLLRIRSNQKTRPAIATSASTPITTPAIQALLDSFREGRGPGDCGSDVAVRSGELKGDDDPDGWAEEPELEADVEL